jgi:hypothetical protein
VLSVFEFFNGLDIGKRFRSDPVDGAEFAELITAEQPVVTAVLRRGYEVAEITYPFGKEARFGREDALPWILVSALPRLSDDPDALFDETVAFATGLPRQPLRRHYLALFDWLGRRAGRANWIERSGSSIDYLESLVELFPGARFLHIHRDGTEAALSMREHHAYRLPIALLYAPPELAAGRVTLDDLRADPGPDDPVSQILSSRPPIEYYGRYWSDQVLRGFRALRTLDADCYREVRFEELLSEPADVLRDVAKFFGLDAEKSGWIPRAAALVGPPPAARFENLSHRERAVLAAECRPGRRLLGRPD